MGLNFSSFKRHEDLFTDELVEKAMKRISKNREKLADWIKENDPVNSCPVCTFKNIGYNWDKIYCLDCGWSKEYKVPYKGKMSITRDLQGEIKQVFGVEMGKRKTDETLKKADLDYLPIDFDDFKTGEYTEQEIEFLENRMREILDTEHIEFSKKDIASIHFLVLQELKLKKIFRRETIIDITNGDFSKVKKDELTVYDKLQAKVDDIIESQSKSDEEVSLYDKIQKELDGDDLANLENSYKKEQDKLNKKIKEDKEERDKIISNDGLLEKRLEELEK